MNNKPKFIDILPYLKRWKESCYYHVREHYQLQIDNTIITEIKLIDLSMVFYGYNNLNRYTFVFESNETIPDNLQLLKLTKVDIIDLNFVSDPIQTEPLELNKVSDILNSLIPYPYTSQNYSVPNRYKLTIDDKTVVCVESTDYDTIRFYIDLVPYYEFSRDELFPKDRIRMVLVDDVIKDTGDETITIQDLRKMSVEELTKLIHVNSVD